MAFNTHYRRTPSFAATAPLPKNRVQKITIVSVMSGPYNKSKLETLGFHSKTFLQPENNHKFISRRTGRPFLGARKSAAIS